MPAVPCGRDLRKRFVAFLSKLQRQRKDMQVKDGENVFKLRSLREKEKRRERALKSGTSMRKEMVRAGRPVAQSLGHNPGEQQKVARTRMRMRTRVR